MRCTGKKGANHQAKEKIMKQYKASLLIDYSTFVPVSDVDVQVFMGCVRRPYSCTSPCHLPASPAPTKQVFRLATSLFSPLCTCIFPLFYHLAYSLIHRLSNPILQKQIPFFSQITFFEVLNICNPANQPFGFLCQGYQSSQTRLHFFTSDTQRGFNGLSR